MADQADDLLKRALALPERERAQLAGNLLESLDTTVDDNVDSAWQEVIARRLEEVNTGKVKTIPWSEAQKKGRALLHGE